MIRALLLVAIAAVPAVAAPRVDLDRCTSYDAAELARAIDNELPIDAGAHPYVVVVQCPDLVTAIMNVEPVPATGSIGRALDLGEVPSDLRLKLLALAVAEMVKIAATLPPPTAPAPTRPLITMAMPPRHIAPKVAPVTSTAIERVTPAAPQSFSLSPRLGVRMFELTPSHPLATAGFELGARSFRIGVDAGFGQDTEAEGRLRAWMATLSLAYELCSGAVCALARIEGGEAGVTARGQGYNAGENLSHLYAQVGPAVELAHRFDGWSFVAALDVGYSWGPIADIYTTRAFALAGLVGGAKLGARWQ